MKHVTLLIGLCIPLCICAQAPLQQETVGFVSFNEGKIVALAEAFSQDQYAWRPAHGVRSVGEVLTHIAAANYFFMKSSGVTLPAGIDPGSMEKEITEKDAIIDAVKDSYAFLKEHIASWTQEQLADPVPLPFPGEYSKQTVLLLTVDHVSEHLGQLIAYARMNGITPAWNQE